MLDSHGILDEFMSHDLKDKFEADPLPSAKQLFAKPTELTLGRNIFFHEEASSFLSAEATPVPPAQDEKKKGASIKAILAAKWAQRQQELQGESGEMYIFDKIQKDGLFTQKELEEIENEKKGIVKITVNFDDEEGMTEEDKEIIRNRLAMQKRQFRELEKRDRKHKLARIRSVHPFVTNEEAIYALQACHNDVEDVVIKLTSFSFLQEMRRRIAINNQKVNPNEQKNINPVISAVRKLEAPPKKEEPEEEEEEDNDDDFKPRSDDDEVSYKGKKTKKKSSGTGKRRAPRLKLDDAIKQSENMEGWSEARIKAFKALDKNPNAYYYRFNAPGQQQRNGVWTKKEKEIFFQRLKEFKIIGCESPQWGLFSIPIEGRVGYQCANYYRQLIKKKEILDPNYWVDEDGEIHCKFGKGCRRRKMKEHKEKEEEGGETASATPEVKKTKTRTQRKKETKKKPAKKTKSKRRRRKNEDEDDVIYASEVSDSEEEKDEFAPKEEEEEEPAPKRRKTQGSKAKEEEEEVVQSKYHQNPLPGFKDPITQTEIEQPAISPYGHVAGYRTWLRILSQEPKNVCPFTKQSLSKRDLVKLTFDNIDYYRGKIINI